jgi:predicted sulfurtransferase
MKMRRFAFYAMVLSAGMLMVALGCATMESSKPYPMVPRMPIEELKNRLDDPSLIILDARQNKDWDKSTVKIKGAVRELPADLIRWQPKYPKDKTIVIYCA